MKLISNESLNKLRQVEFYLMKFKTNKNNETFIIILLFLISKKVVI